MRLNRASALASPISRADVPFLAAFQLRDDQYINLGNADPATYGSGFRLSYNLGTGNIAYSTHSTARVPVIGHVVDIKFTFLDAPEVKTVRECTRGDVLYLDTDPSAPMLYLGFWSQGSSGVVLDMSKTKESASRVVLTSATRNGQVIGRGILDVVAV